MVDTRQRPPPLVAVFSDFAAYGGVERMMVNLANEIASRGYRVELVLMKGICPYEDQLAAGVTSVDLGSRHALSSLPPLFRYLRRRRPAALLAIKFRANNVALAARALARTHTPTTVRVDLAVRSSAPAKAGRRWLRLLPIRWLYPKADGIIAVSRGVARELIEIVPAAREHTAFVPNPVLADRLFELAAEPLDHPWIADDPPLVLGVGRLTRRKGFHVLLQAFAQVRRVRPCHLILVGDGAEASALETLARQLGIAEDVELVGYSANPYAYMARADVLVLSSFSEGSPNVLTEAMALGTPVVATDCPHGPADVLDGGRLAPLVPVGDATAMAEAIIRTLDAPPPSRTLSQAVSAYHVEKAATAYLGIMGLPARAPEASP